MKKGGYRRLLFFVFLIVVINIIALKVEARHINVFNAQQMKYELFVNEWFKDINNVVYDYPIGANVVKEKGEAYLYESLQKRERVLNSFSYDIDMVPTRYLEFHKKMINAITEYKNGVELTKNAILSLDLPSTEQGIRKMAYANNLLSQLRLEFFSLQTYH